MRQRMTYSIIGWRLTPVRLMPLLGAHCTRLAGEESQGRRALVAEAFARVALPGASLAAFSADAAADLRHADDLIDALASALRQSDGPDWDAERVRAALRGIHGAEEGGESRRRQWRRQCAVGRRLFDRCCCSCRWRALLPLDTSAGVAALCSYLHLPWVRPPHTPCTEQSRSHSGGGRWWQRRLRGWRCRAPAWPPSAPTPPATCGAPTI
jgi:hypothetical protein